MLYALDDIRPILHGDVFIADSAEVMGNIEIFEDASVWFQVVIRGDNERITIGRRSNIQDGSILHTDIGIPLTIGDNVTVGHKVMLHGCTIGSNSLIGIGSIIMNKASIGINTIIGANSLVPEGKVIPDGVLAFGAPAKVIRDLTEEEIHLIEQSAEIYVQNGKRFGRGLRELP